MSGAGQTIELEDAGMRAALEVLARAWTDPSPVMDDVGSYLETATAQRFEHGTGPDGEAWKPSLRASLGGKTLVDSGRLRDSIARTATNDSVTLSTAVLYAAIHQFGGVIKPKRQGVLAHGLRFQLASGAWVMRRQVTMPARPFLGVGEDDKTEIRAIFADWFGDMARGDLMT